MIGRSVSGSIRQLLIGKRAHGYVATYRYIAGGGLVMVMSIRSQRQFP